MKISKLVEPEILSQNQIDPNIEITGLAFDSREIKPGFVFFATAGYQLDGHKFIPDALNHGAALVIGEKEQSSLGLPDSSPYVQVENTRKSLSQLAARFYDYPAKKMRVIGVTGTDGKTTTSNLITGILKKAGKKVGKITTVDAEINGQLYDMGVHVTTPDSLSIQKFLSDMARGGTEYAIIESTSHGLSQHRLSDCEFDIGVLTNITHEHYDFHGNYAEYRNAKAILFELVNQTSGKNYEKFAVINADDESFDFMKAKIGTQLLSYGIQNQDADILATDIEMTSELCSYLVTLPGDQTMKVESKILGNHNIYNSLAAIGVAYSQSIPCDIIQDYFLNPDSPKGRFEKVDLGQDFQVFVDYAHTENALNSLLSLANQIAQKRVILLFGLSGGPRDKSKRPAMGKIACENSDLAIITAVDWYPSENVDDILAQIEQGFIEAGGKVQETYWKIPNREEAIHFAISLAWPGDIVLIAGKGHETSLSINGVENVWSEVGKTKEALTKRLNNEK